MILIDLVHKVHLWMVLCFLFGGVIFGQDMSGEMVRSSISILMSDACAWQFKYQHLALSLEVVTYWLTRFVNCRLLNVYE